MKKEGFSKKTFWKFRKGGATGFRVHPQNTQTTQKIGLEKKQPT